MKSIVILAIVIGVGYAFPDKKAHLTPDQSAKLLQHSMQCIMDTGVSADAIVKVKSGQFSDDPAFKKFLFCVFRKAGIAKSDGHLKVDAVLNKYPKDVDRDSIKKVLEECDKQDGKDAADRSFNIFKCFHAKTPVHLAF